MCEGEGTKPNIADCVMLTPEIEVELQGHNSWTRLAFCKIRSVFILKKAHYNARECKVLQTSRRK